MGRRGYPPEFRRRVLDAACASQTPRTVRPQAPDAGIAGRHRLHQPARRRSREGTAGSVVTTRSGLTKLDRLRSRAHTRRTHTQAPR